VLPSLRCSVGRAAALSRPWQRRDRPGFIQNRINHRGVVGGFFWEPTHSRARVPARACHSRIDLTAKEVRARPATSTLCSKSRAYIRPPRALAWRTVTVGAPTDSTHHGATAHIALPVTGSSARPSRGAKTRIETSTSGPPAQATITTELGTKKESRINIQGTERLVVLHDGEHTRGNRTGTPR